MGYPHCTDCGKELKDYRSKLCRVHSKTGKRNPIYGKLGKENHRYKGGYIHKTLGYKFVMHKGKKMYEHRLVAESKIGRALNANEIVHHINGIKTDNRPENLEIITQSEHVVIHKPRLGTGK